MISGQERDPPYRRLSCGRRGSSARDKSPGYRPMIEGRMGEILLIVNGDDFGASEEVNEAVVLAFRTGVLTSCSLMTSGNAFDHAVGLARENPGLAVGIHLVTVLGRPVLPPFEIPDIVDTHGRLLSNPTLAGLKYYFSLRARRQLMKELDAQFRKFLSTGLHPSHIDSHLHMHIHPVIRDAAIELGMRYGVRRMRVPRDDLDITTRFQGARPFSNKLSDRIFRSLNRHMRAKLRRNGFVFPDRVFGLFMSGRMNEDYFLHVLDHLHDASNEIYFHPSVHPRDRTPGVQDLHGMREFRALTSAAVKNRIRESGIHLADYRRLDRDHEPAGEAFSSRSKETR